MSNSIEWYGPNGKEVTMDEAKAFLDDPSVKYVADDELENGTWISTIYLGLDHGLGMGKILIYETMVFPSRGDYSELDTRRYQGREEALQGHEAMVNAYSSKMNSAVIPEKKNSRQKEA